jgi:hypothetical protein
MQTLSLLPAQIQNRVGLLQQQLPTSSPSYPPYPTDTYDNFQQLPTTPTGNDSYTPSSAQGSAQPPAPSSEMSSPIASPAYATPSAVQAAPVPLWKKPVAWVVGGVAAAGLGTLTYFNLDWIKDKLGIGGNEGKLERAKAQFEALKTEYKNAETDEAKEKIVTKMLAVLERNNSALFESLQKGSLNAYATELKALKESGNEFAQTALKKATKAAKDNAKNGLEDAGNAIKNSGALDTIIRVGAVALTIPLWWSVAVTSGFATWIGGLGIGTVLTGIGNTIATNATLAGTSITAAAATPAAGTLATAAGATYATAAAINPNVVKTPLTLLGDAVLFIPRSIGKGIKNLKP